MRKGDLVKIKGEIWEGVIEFIDRDMVGVVKSFPIDKVGEFSIYEKNKLRVIKRSERTKKSLGQLTTQELIKRVTEGRIAFIEKIREGENDSEKRDCSKKSQV